MAGLFDDLIPQQTSGPLNFNDLIPAAPATAEPSLSYWDRLKQVEAVPGQAASALNSVVRSIASGATLGGADRIAAGLGAATGIGGTAGDYSGNLAAQQGETNAFRQAHPYIDAAGNLAGGALGLTASLPAGIMAAPTAVGRIWTGMAVGSGAGAVGGALSSPDLTNLPDVGKNALGGGLTGGTLGAAIPAGGAFLGSALRAFRPGAPGGITADKIGELKSAAYKKAEDLGVAYSPEAYSGLVNKIAADAEAQHISPTVSPAASSRIADLQRDAAQRLNPPALAAPQDIPFDAPPAVPPTPGGPAPASLVTFLQRLGGVKDEGGDLASMGLTKYPGLVRPLSGKPMDEARRAAREAGYLGGDTSGLANDPTVSDFIDQIANHPTYSIHDQEAVAARQARKAATLKAQYDQPPPEPTPPGESDMFPGDQPSGGNPISLDELENWRKSVNRSTYDSPIGEERHFGGQIRNNIDQFIANAGPDQLAPGAGPGASEAMLNARDLATRDFKAQALAQALDKGALQTAKTGTGQNMENVTRQRLDELLKSRSWSPDEEGIIRQGILGTPARNFLRSASRMAPSGLNLSLLPEVLMGGGLGYTAGGPGAAAMLAAAPAAVGMASKYVGGKLMDATTRRLMQTILAGGTTPASAGAIGPGPTRAALAAALAGNENRQQRQLQNSPQ